MKMSAIVKKDFLVENSYRLHFFMQYIGILFSATSFYFLSRLFEGYVSPQLEPYGGDYFSFVLIGIAFTGYLNVGIRSFTNIISRSQATGTLEAMLVTPTRISTLLLSSSIWPFLTATIRVIFYFVVGISLFGVDVGNINIPSVMIIIVLTILCFSGIGILSASFILVFKRGSPVNWFHTSFSGLLGGMMYPIEIMPSWLQSISTIIPLTHSLKAIRMAVLQGHSPVMLSREIMILFIFTLILLPAGIVAFNYAVKKAKREGSLSKY